jgi:hypothetical protein
MECFCCVVAHLYQVSALGFHLLHIQIQENLHLSFFQSQSLIYVPFEQILFKLWLQLSGYRFPVSIFHLLELQQLQVILKFHRRCTDVWSLLCN